MCWVGPVIEVSILRHTHDSMTHPSRKMALF